VEIPIPTWEFLRERIADVERSDAWHATCDWALDRLIDHLGATWLEDAYEKIGRLPGTFIGVIGGHPQACAELIELAVRLELMSNTPGFAAARRGLDPDPLSANLLHASLQLEVAALAQHQGFGIRLEPGIGTRGKHADALLTDPHGREMVVEACVVLPDDPTRDYRELTDRIYAAIHRIEAGQNVEIEGDLTRLVTSHEEADLLEVLEKEARLVARDSVERSVDLHGAVMQIRPDREGARHRISGPPMTGELLWRVLDRLQKKADQTKGVDGAWLRADAMNGLWRFTTWAYDSLETKTGVLGEYVRQALAGYDHVAGVVVSGGCQMGGFHDPDQEIALKGGNFAMVTHIAPLRFRETIVFTMPWFQDDLSGADTWREIYAAEPLWLDYSLAQLGLPSVAEIFTAASSR